MVALNVHLADEAATLAWGRALATCIEPGDTIHLEGELGAGKTTLVRGVLRGLGYEGRVKSPTYALVEVYEVSRLHLHHFDFYRFGESREWSDAGFRESFDGRTVTLVEWPEKAMGTLPRADLRVVLTSSHSGRNASWSAISPRGMRMLECLRGAAPPAPCPS